MANTTISPNMGLPVPNVGVDPGPDWANNINSCLSILDGHNHTPGSGVQITPAALNLNSDVSFLFNNAINLGTVRLQVKASPLAAVAPNLACLQAAGTSGDLYFNDANGNTIRITQSGSVTGSSGTITGLPSGTASAAYSSISGTFIFQQATSTAANIDVGSIIVRYPGSYPTPTGNYILLQAPSSLATGYGITLPANAPASSAPLIMDNTGTITVSPAQYTAFLPTGVFLPYGGTSAPIGYLMCDGTSYLRSTYPGLFAVIGTAYGSADGTHFNVPDMRGMFVRGVDNGAGNDPDTLTRTASNLGGNTGDNVGSLQQDQFEQHGHPIGAFNAGEVGGSNYARTGGNARSVSIETDYVGGNQTNPVNIYANFIIKT